jgi:hypothetical protein
MPTSYTEGRHAAEFILSEANGARSRENGTLVSGQDLAAGTVVMDNGAGKLTAYTAGSVTDGGTDEAAGILLYAVDASDGDVACSYLARDAEVNLKLITYPDESTAGGEEDNTIASLALLNIIARD